MGLSVGSGVPRAGAGFGPAEIRFDACGLSVGHREASDLLQSRSQKVERVTEANLWNHPLLLATALLGFLLAEWVLRKRRDLV